MSNKQELVDAIARKTKLSKKDSQRALEAFCSSVKDSLRRNERVSLIGFGTFEVRTRKARTGRNPRTGEQLNIQAKKVPAFRAGKELKAAVQR